MVLLESVFETSNELSRKFLDHKGEIVIFKSSMWNCLPEK